MPDITVAGTYDKDSAGFKFLESAGFKNRTILLAGTMPSSIDIQYIDDGDTPTARTLENGSITALPASIEIGLLAVDLQIVVVGSISDLNVMSGGVDSA